MGLSVRRKAARCGTSEEEKEKMEKMLLEFIEENSKNDQIEMKQRVEIKRQMDKFEARG